MKADITTQQIGMKWHGYIEGRPDIDLTALTEEAARRKAEQLRERIGPCGDATKMFGRDLVCERIKDHHEPGRRILPHMCGSIVW